MKAISTNRHYLTLAAAALLAALAPASAQTPVAITNSGFENPVLTDGQLSSGAIPGWSAFNGRTLVILNPSSATDLTAEAPEGQNVGVITSSSTEGGMSQTLAAQFQANVTYALTVKVANTKFTGDFPGYRVQLAAGGTILAEDDNSQAVAEDSVVTATFNYTYDAGLHAGVVGQALEIRLLSKGLVSGQEIAFDDVQLTLSRPNPVASPGGPYAVLSIGSLSLNGSGSTPSDGQTITAYDWDLNNDDLFGDVTGATPAAIPYATLTGTYGMSVGSHTIKLRVTDSAAKTSTTSAAVTLTPASNNANLSDLVTTPATTLTPTFAPSTLEYTASVLYPNISITVTPTAEDSLATIKVNGITVASGSESGPITLSVGPNIINTVVTAQDATTKTYKLTVTVAVADPVAVPGGPYTLLSTGSLSLNGSASLPSDGQTITAYEWDLDNDGDFTDNPITGANPTPISYADLKSVHGMTVGANTIRLRVTDSLVKTSTVSTTVTLLSAVIYEPFAQSPGGLNGAAVGTGLTATWSASTGTAAETVAAGSLFYSTLATSGNQASGPQAGSFARANPGTTLSSLGLLDNGKELWFSFLYKSTRTGGINDQTGFALGTDGINTTNVVPMLNSGNGIGVSIDRESNVNASVWAGGPRAVDNKTGGIPANAATLIVGKIKWGATDTDVETVTIYLPGTDLALPAEKSTKSTAAAMNQSTFDTISFGNKGDAGAVVTFDEIRFGASYADVVPVETAAPTLVSITDNLLGGPIGEDVSIITYDLTFDKSMDLSTITTADLDNAGTASISIGTITQPSPNVIRVEVLPTTIGTVQLRIPAASEIKSLVQANLDTTADILDDTTITINSGATPPDLPTTNRWWDGAVTSGATNGASGGGTGAWSTTTTNWDRGAGFENPVGWDNGAGTTAIFGGTAGTVTLDEDEEINIKNLTFTHTTGTYTITGSALNFTSGTITASNPPTNVVDAIIRSNITGSPALNLKLMDGDRQFTLNPAASGSMIIGAVTGDGGNGSEKLNLQGGAGSSGTIASVSGPKWIQTSGTWTLNGNASGYGHSITGGTLTLNANVTATNRSVTLGGTGVINYNVANAVSATAATSASGSDNGFRLQTGATLDQTSGAAITTSTTNPSMTWEGNWTFIGTNGANSNLNLGTGNVFLKASSPQVSLTDAATTLTVGGVIANDATGGRGLTKAGAGTLELRGANTYTGPTTVNAGTLKLDTSGALDAAGRVSIAAGATLDLTAKTAGPATYTWNTTSLSASGAATPATITGTAQGTIHMGIKPISLITDGTNPSLTVTGAALTLGNNPFTVVVPGPALGNGVYPLVSADSITGTVNPAASYTGGNGLAGGATGVVSISGNTVILTVTGGDPFASWAGSGVAFDADANNDGVDNGMAWVLGAANKDANAIALLPTLDNTTDPDFFIFTYRRDDDANTDPKTTIKVEYGSTLAGWTTAVHNGTDIIITPTDDFYAAGIDKVQVKIRRTLAVRGKLFARLNVQNTP